MNKGHITLQQLESFLWETADSPLGPMGGTTLTPDRQIQDYTMRSLPMIPLLLSWLIMFLGICGFGALACTGFHRLSSRMDLGPLNIFQLFWVGFAATIAFAQVWNVFYPLNAISLALWLLAGLAGQAVFFRDLRTWRQGMGRGHPSLFRIRLILFAACFVLLLYLGADGVTASTWSGAYDTDLYHFSSIRWMNEYAAPLGLGNLHSRLAHTSGFLVFSALMDNLYWDGSTAWLTYGLILSVVSGQWLWTLLMPHSVADQRSRLFCLLTLPYVAMLQTSIYPMLYFDNVALLIQLVLVVELLRGFPSLKDSGADHIDSTRVTRLMTLLILATLCFSLKPIGAISLLFVLLLTVAVAIHIAGLSISRWKSIIPTLVAVCAIPAVILISHLTRNIILSGWLLFPAPIGPLPVDWAMPGIPLGKSHWHELQSVAGQYEVIKAWARLPGPEYAKAWTEGFSYWFPLWRDRVWHGIEIRWFYVGIAAILMHLAALASSVRGPRTGRYDLFLISLTAANLCFWFFMAPDMRFGQAFFWIWMGLGGSLLLSRPFIRPVVAYTLAGLLAVTVLKAMSVSFVPSHQPLLGSLGKAGARPTKTVVIENGQAPPLVVHVPQSGDRCGDAPLPCTPYPLKTLALRHPGSLASGFKSMGTDN